MACLLGVQRSFEKAEVALLEVAGWDLDDNTIRQLCHATAARASSTRQRRATAEAFAQAEGDLELQIDAGKVNTPGGWRDVKVAVFAAASRASRSPRRSGTSATCRRRRCVRWWPRVEEAARVRRALRGRGDAAGADRSRSGCSVLGDGAEWIWNLAEQHFAGASQCLDFWHAAGHLGAAAKAVFGSGSGEAAKRRWAGARGSCWRTATGA